ncbi:hypothetical protein SH668x_001213 [Planctomicrobium sp. SH668]|uniref:hypothetical protein n=1 Tax=Planctomicrobium sp. SH668 TaxID=3448126 RepID=UPI003F5C9D56
MANLHPSAVGEIKLTTTYALLLTFRRMQYPRIVRKIKRSENAVAILTEYAAKANIELIPNESQDAHGVGE